MLHPNHANNTHAYCKREKMRNSKTVCASRARRNHNSACVRACVAASRLWTTAAAAAHNTHAGANVVYAVWSISGNTSRSKCASVCLAASPCATKRFVGSNGNNNNNNNNPNVERHTREGEGHSSKSSSSSSDRSKQNGAHTGAERAPKPIARRCF